MRDDDRRAPAHESLERLLYEPLRLGVERTGRLIKQQYWRITQDGARQRNPLALSAGEARSALAEERVVALGKFSQEFIGRSRPRRGLDFLIARPRASIADVLACARPEQHGVLRHKPDLHAQRDRIEIDQGPLIDQHGAGCRIVESQQHLERRALASSRGPDKCDRLARRHLEAELIKRGLLGARGITERHPVKADPAKDTLRQGEWRGRRADGRRRCEQLGQSLHRACRALDLAPHLGQRGGRGADKYGIGQELQQLPTGHLPLQHRLCAHP